MPEVPFSLPALTIVIPASNEAARIGACLDALARQEGLPDGARIEVVIAANGCRDDTAAVARAAAAPLAARGWGVIVLDLPQGGKIGALNAADARATGAARLYLDADIVCAPPLLARLLAALDRPEPVYAGARLVVAPPASTASRLFARFWARLPFMAEGVTGAGLFAVNAAGRARWDRFPDVIADDAYVRALFAPHERMRVEADYLWPISEGLPALVRVRGRQDAGTRELAARFPDLAAQADDRPGGGRVLGLAARDPLGFAVYAGVRALARVSRAGRSGWARNR